MSEKHQYQLFGSKRSNLKHDALAFFVVTGIIVILIVIWTADLTMAWLENLPESTTTEP